MVPCPTLFAFSVSQATVGRTARRNLMLVNPNLVITMGPVPHNLEASIVPALQALWGCAVRGMWMSAWTGPATPQAQLPATLWPMPFIASVCLDTQVRLTVGHTDLYGIAEQTLKT